MGRRPRPFDQPGSRAQRSRSSARLAIALAAVGALVSVGALGWQAWRGVTPSAAGGPGTAAASPPAASVTPVAPAPASPPIVPTAGMTGVRPTVPLFARWANPGITLHVPILMYHVIGPGTDAPREPPDLVVSAPVFAGQLEALQAAGWHTITMAQLAADLIDGHAPARRTFVISVDDGHVDGLTVALPILRRLGDDATFYIVIGRLDRSGYLTPAEVAALAAAGMDVGNHTVHHLDLAIEPPSIVSAEIAGAEQALTSMAGYPPVSLAYPSGEENDRVLWAVRALGLDLAVTTRFGALEDFADRFALPRVRIHPETTPAALVATLSRLVGVPPPAGAAR